MNIIDRTLPWLPRIDLAREPDFSIGDLRVRPSRREIQVGESLQVLQPRVMQVLVALAHPSSQVVSQDELISRCWGGLTVGEDAVTRCIGQLRRAAAGWPDPPFQIETIPGVGYRLAASPSASPVADEAPAPQTAGVERRQRAWIGWAGGGAALAAAAAGAAVLALHPWSAPQTAKAAPTPAIALLGYQAAGGDAPEQALASALPGRVADALSKYNATVISAPAASGGSDFTVAGRITRKAGRISVTTDLSDPRSHVLISSFDTTVPDDPDIDVASQIASHLALSLDPSKLSGTLGGKMSPADYVLIARANDAIERWDLPAMIDETHKLAVRHPEDGEVQASQAVTEIFAAEGVVDGRAPELLRMAREDTVRAEQLNPNSALLFFAKSMLVNGPLAYAEKERLLRRSMNANPDFHVAYKQLGRDLLSVGRTNEGAALIKRAAQLDPMSMIIVAEATRDLFMAGRFEDATQNLAHQEQIAPDYRYTPLGKYSVAFHSGDLKQVLALDERYHLSVEHGGPRALMVEAARAHDPAAVGKLYDDCADAFRQKAWKEEDSACLVAMVRAGRLDDAFRLAALAYPDERGFAPMGADVWILTTPPPRLDPAWMFAPAMKPFRDDPRFWNVALRSGLVGYWQSTGHWPDACQDRLDSCRQSAAKAVAQG